ncbi:MAG: Fic/DOC family protein [Thermoanaerobaculia bacterium]
MQQAESQALLALTEALLDEVTDTQRFTEGNIVRMHRRWLGEIYSWAGEYRRVNVAKGDVLFAAADQVPRLMAELGRGELATPTPCQGMRDERLVRAFAVVHAELILIHPFREGNGRLARLLNTLMAAQVDFPLLDFGGIKGQARAAYFAAIQAAAGRDHGPIEQVFEGVPQRTLRTVR